MILRRIAGERFSEVVKEWEGTAVVIAGGPSLTLEQVEAVRGLHCIAVNDAYLWADFADVLYFADAKWWEWHIKGVAKPVLGLTADEVKQRFASFKGQKCSIQNSMERITDEATHILRNKNGRKHGNGISLDPKALETGRHSAYQAVNLAILAGVKTILLLGVDGGPINGKTHWSGGHPKLTPVRAYEHYRKAWAEGRPHIEAAGVTVINCSPGTLVDAFPKVELEDALCAL